jgi:predicted PurR-regulated permease PerM
MVIAGVAAAVVVVMVLVVVLLVVVVVVVVVVVLSASQEIPRVLLNPKFHYRIHNCPPPVPILSQLDPVDTPTSHILKIHLNIILPFLLGSPQRSLYLRFLKQNPVLASPLPHKHYMPHPSHSSRFYHPHNGG